MALGVHPCSVQVLSTSRAINASDVASDLTLAWDIAIEVKSDLKVVWDINITVNRDLNLKWDIQEGIVKDLTLIWDINNNAGKDLTLVWDITDKNAFVVNKNRYCAGGASRTKPFCG